MRARLNLRTAFLVVALLAARPTPAQEIHFAVIINAQNGATNVPFDELRRIFLGERRFWPGSKPIRLIVRVPGSPEHRALLKLVGMTESEYKRYWTQQVFRGEAQAEPKTVMTNEMQIDAIRRNAGAIALIDVRDIQPGSRTVTIDKLAPADAEYPLHE